MVAPAKTQSTAQSAPPGGASVPKSGMAKGKAAPAAIKPPTYDLTAVAQDYTSMQLVRQTFDTDVLLKSYQLWRQALPTTNYLTVFGDDGATNIATQVVDPTYSFLIDKSCSYNLSGDVSVRFAPDDNPGAAPSDCGYTERLVEHVWKCNDDATTGMNAHFLAHLYLQVYGYYVAEFEWLPGEERTLPADCPILKTLHDPLSVAWDLDANHFPRRVIVNKRRRVQELPDEWRTGTLATAADDQEIQIYEDFNRVTMAIIVEGAVVYQGPHGFTDIYGVPAIPFVIQLHDPMPIRLGDGPPQLTASQPRQMIVGRPPWMTLIPQAEYRGFLLTAERFNVKDQIVPWSVVSGQARPDWQAKTVRIPEPNSGSFQFAEPPNLLQNIEIAMKTSDTLMEVGGANVGVMGGQQNIASSGTAVQAATSFVKRKNESVKQTHEHGMEREALVILALVKNTANVQASTARRYQQATGQPLKVINGDESQHFNNASAFPGYQYITGNTQTPIDNLTVANIYCADVSITPYEGLPKEQKLQLAVQFAQMNAKQMEAGGLPIIPQEQLYGEWFDMPNPQGVIQQLELDAYNNRPAAPYRLFRQLRAKIAEMQGTGMDPGAADQQLQAVAQAEIQAWQQDFTQALKAAQQMIATAGQPPPPGGGAPPGGPPPPNAAPPNAAPPGPPPSGPPPQPPMPGGLPLTVQPGGPQPAAMPGGQALGQPLPGGPPSLPPGLTGM